MNQQVTTYPTLILFREGLTTAFLRHMLLVKEVKLLHFLFIRTKLFNMYKKCIRKVLVV